MNSITIEVVGNPKGQPRPRATIRGKHAAMYDDRKHAVYSWRQMIALAAQPIRPEQPIDGPIRVDYTLYFPRPKSHFNSKGVVKPKAPQWYTSKPDRDNADKAILDTLTQLGFWRDDAQVCAGEIEKVYATDRPAGATIKVRAIGATT